MLSLRLRVSYTLRLAHPADSLVRVPRRVGWATTSLSRGTPSAEEAPGSKGYDPRPREESRCRKEPKGQGASITAPGVTSDGDLADVALTDYNATAPEDAAGTFPPTLSSRYIPSGRSSHTTESAPPARRSTSATSAQTGFLPPSSFRKGSTANQRLNPAAARLVGPTVFSLNGFTCS